MGVQSSFSEEHSLMGSRRLGRRNRTDFPVAGHGMMLTWVGELIQADRQIQRAIFPPTHPAHSG